MSTRDADQRFVRRFTSATSALGVTLVILAGTAALVWPDAPQAEAAAQVEPPKPQHVKPGTVLKPKPGKPPLSPCAMEDSPGPCFWNAATRGNGQGNSFRVTPAGEVIRITEDYADVLDAAYEAGEPGR